jgi:hypothetical protein
LSLDAYITHDGPALVCCGQWWPLWTRPLAALWIGLPFLCATCGRRHLVEEVRHA